MSQQQCEWFENWFGSPYYRMLYTHRNEDEAKTFVLNLLNFLQPNPDSRMLDIACGEGRHSIQLAEKGFDVTGIDLSPLSISHAKKAEQENLSFFVHDMRFPFYNNYFDFAFNFFTSFGYFAHARDNDFAAQSFARNLKKNGTLVVDYLNKNYSIERLIPFEKIEKGGIAFSIKRVLTETHFVKEISFVDFNNKQRIYFEKVAAFSLYNFKEIFANAGLFLEKAFGDYQLNDYYENLSPRMIMVFKKQ
jgi:SAM-dependent methyltransferase